MVHGYYSRVPWKGTMSIINQIIKTKPIVMSYTRKTKFKKYVSMPWTSDMFYKGGWSLRDRVGYQKKSDLITPTLHRWDETSVSRYLDKMMGNTESIRAKWSAMYSGMKTPDDQIPDFASYVRKLKSNMERLPKHLAYDIYKMYYHKKDSIKFTERNKENRHRYQVIDRSSDAVGKIMSEGSSLKSAVFTGNVILHLLMHLTAMDYTNHRSADKVQKCLSGDPLSKNTSEQGEDILNQILNSKEFTQGLEKTLSDAKQTCKMIDDNIDADTQNQIFDTGGNGSLDVSEMSIDKLSGIEHSIREIKMNIGSLKERIQNILNRSFSYFSSRKFTEYEDFFNTTDMSALDDYVLLHPALRKIFVQDILIPQTRYKGKINVYVDISGSMAGTSGVKNFEGRIMSKMAFARILVAKLHEMDMIEELYTFDNFVDEKRKLTMLSIATIDGNGGTNLNNVVQHIEKNKVNSLVITDAEDNCTMYSDLAYFVGVKGANFAHFHAQALQKYSESQQMIVFDGNRIYSVDKKGKIEK